jgi:Tat protein secretion system quality control protein TatD with DNase activity
VPYVAQLLADLRGMPLEEMADLTSQNFNQLFPKVMI